jgi:hypothetical protein
MFQPADQTGTKTPVALNDASPHAGLFLWRYHTIRQLIDVQDRPASGRPAHEAESSGTE